MSQYSSWYEYQTIYGDTFDSIALDLYDDEKYASEIIAENPDYCDVLIFEAGITLFLPEIDTTDKPDTQPPWR